MKIWFITFLCLLVLPLSSCKTGSSFRNNDASEYITPRISTITNSANNIDKVVVGSEFQAPVKVETDTIRKNAEELSYENINALYKGYGLLIEQLKARVAELEGEAKTKIKLFLIKLSVGLTLLAGALLFFKQRELAGLGVGFAAVFFGAAQVYGLWWVELGLGVILLGGIIYALVILYKKTKKEEAAHITFSELENLYNESDQETKDWMDENLFGRLSKKMDEAHKIVIREEDLTK